MLSASSCNCVGVEFATGLIGVGMILNKGTSLMLDEPPCALHLGSKSVRQGRVRGWEFLMCRHFNDLKVSGYFRFADDFLGQGQVVLGSG